MTKLQFKEIYSKYRRVNKDFYDRLHQYPCGYDDGLAENFDHRTNEWLDDNPVIKSVVNALNDGDFLEDKASGLFACNIAQMKYRRKTA